MDPFDDLLHLEERFYEEGHRQGAADGTRAGLVEGRTLGLETGFQKFVETGRLQGKAVVWASRLGAEKAGDTIKGTEIDEAKTAVGHLAPLPSNNARLRKTVRTLYALVEPGTLPIANTDEAVNDVDDRVKRARGKARIVEKMVGELAGERSDEAAGTRIATATSP